MSLWSSVSHRVEPEPPRAQDRVTRLAAHKFRLAALRDRLSLGRSKANRAAGLRFPVPPQPKTAARCALRKGVRRHEPAAKKLPEMGVREAGSSSPGRQPGKQHEISLGRRDSRLAHRKTEDKLYRKGCQVKSICLQEWSGTLFPESEDYGVTKIPFALKVEHAFSYFAAYSRRIRNRNFCQPGQTDRGPFAGQHSRSAHNSRNGWQTSEREPSGTKRRTVSTIIVRSVISIAIDDRRPVQFPPSLFVAIEHRVRIGIRTTSELIERRFAQFADVPYQYPVDRQQWEELWETDSSSG
jgi:hypothetical protein